MTTPEGKVKALTKRLFKELQREGYPLYYHMPVQNGMGAPTLDFVGCANGAFFAIETKAPGKNPTARQESTIKAMRDAGAEVFVVRDKPSLREFCVWVGEQGKAKL
jgi:hypothetical protein